MGQRPGIRREVQKPGAVPLRGPGGVFSAAIPLTAIYGPTSATAVAAVYAAVYIYGNLKAKRYVINVLLASPLELLATLAGVIHRPKRFYVINKS